MSASPRYEDAEGEALVYPSGHSPVYLWCDDHQQWRKARVAPNGGILAYVEREETESAVTDPTTSPQTLFTGAGWITGVVNSTTSILSIYDDAALKWLVLPGASSFVPIKIATSAKYKVSGTPLGAQVAFVWSAS
jgi:hypothetical protein